MLRVYTNYTSKKEFLGEVDFIDEAHDLLFDDIDERKINVEDEEVLDKVIFNDYIIEGEEEED